MRPINLGTLVLVVIPLVAGGCFYQSQTIDPGKLAAVQNGQTTKDQFIQTFGQPDITTPAGDHNVLVYNHTYAQLNVWAYIPIVQWIIGGYDEQRQALIVILDNKDVVQSWVIKQVAGESTIWNQVMKEEPTTQPIK